jgi:hypothetical protein
MSMPDEARRRAAMPSAMAALREPHYRSTPIARYPPMSAANHATTAAIPADASVIRAGLPRSIRSQPDAET